jgi:methylglyoxal synthase
LETSANLTDRASFLTDPLENLPHDPSLVGHDLITRLAAALVLADVTVAVGRAAKHVN